MNFSASFFDIFGVFVFIYIIILSLLQLKFKKVLDKKFYYLLLIIGIVGLIVDLISVYFAYLK